MEIKRVLAKRFNEVCEEKNITYKELAEKLGLPPKRILRIAWGSRTNPGVLDMIQICDALGMTLDEFFGTEDFDEYRKYTTK